MARRAFWKIHLNLFAVLVAAIFGCSSSAGAEHSPMTEATVVRVTDLGTVSTNPDILARDVAYSAFFHGVSVWIYGDTVLAKKNVDGRRFMSNSWSFTTDLKAQDGITGFEEQLDPSGSPSMMLQETPRERAYNQAHYGNSCREQPCGELKALWPASIVVDPRSNQALVFYMVVDSGPGRFNFKVLGNSVAVWRNLQTLPQRPAFSPPTVPDHPDLMFNQSEPNFGSTALIDNGALYIYGCGRPDNGLDKGCRLGKVDIAHVLDRGAWTFYAGTGIWSSHVESAVQLFDGCNILSVSWNGFLQRYVAIYSKPFSDAVVMRTSIKPEGPWSPEVAAFTALAPAQDHVYDAHAHPEYDANGGQTMYVTYSRSTGFLTSEVRLVAIELKRTSSPR
jgi:hypothetical protein